MLLKIFGNYIKSLRLQRNWTQSELAARSSLHINYISDVEKGRRNISLKNIYKIAKAFEIKIKKLMSFEEHV